jgi:hypothetical protein
MGSGLRPRAELHPIQPRPAKSGSRLFSCCSVFNRGTIYARLPDNRHPAVRSSDKRRRCCGIAGTESASNDRKQRRKAGSSRSAKPVPLLSSPRRCAAAVDRVWEDFSSNSSIAESTYHWRCTRNSLPGSSRRLTASSRSTFSQTAQAHLDAVNGIGWDLPVIGKQTHRGEALLGFIEHFQRPAPRCLLPVVDLTQIQNGALRRLFAAPPLKAKRILLPNRRKCPLRRKSD